LTLLTTDSQLKGALKLIDDFKNKRLTAPVTEKELWRAKTCLFFFSSNIFTIFSERINDSS